MKEALHRTFEQIFSEKNKILTFSFMITYNEALEILYNIKQTLNTENIALQNAVGRTLATDIFADTDLPPFNKSAMDGYACRKQDLKNELFVIETIKAGYVPQKIVTENTCSKIMTGAMIPQGADCVIIVEETEILANNKIRFGGEKTSQNIIFQAEDLKKGEKILSAGEILKPQHIAVLAMVGIHNPLVYKRPTVAVVTTGSELVEPENTPTISQIRNSNAWQLIAQLQQLNIPSKYFGIVADNENDLKKSIQTAEKECDITILTGGVSMGDFDLVPKILVDCGYHIHFHKIAVQPGKPVLFAQNNHKFCFGLPGNPVSAFTAFETLVKPFLHLFSGNYNKPQDILLPFSENYSRKKNNRLLWLPVKITQNNEVETINYHGSAHINALTVANGLAIIPLGKSDFKKGEQVYVRQI